jgi:teichuronic acid exporter
MKNQTINGLKWNTINQVFSIGSKFIVTIFLSRLLGPEAFGTIALIYSFTSIADIFVNAGFKNSIIQDSNVTKRELSSIFFLNITLGLFFFIVIAAFSHLISFIYDDPKLTIYMIVCGLVYLINPFGIVQEALLSKELKFKEITIRQIFGRSISMVTGLTMAYLGYGIWSLIISSLIASFSGVLIYWFQSSWRPSLIFSIIDIKKHWKFTSNVLYSNILFSLVNKIDFMLIGKMLTPNVLGLYSRAKDNAFIPANIIANATRTTFFSVFAKMKGDLENLRIYYAKVSELFLFILTILFSYIILNADELIKLILGSKWIEMTILFQIFCVYVFFYCNSLLRVYLLNALGRSDVDFKLGLVLMPFRLLLLLLPIWLINLRNANYYALVNTLIIVIPIYFYDLNIAKSFSIVYKLKYKSLIMPLFFFTSVFVINLLIKISSPFDSLMVKTLMFFIICLVYWLFEKEKINRYFILFKSSFHGKLS